MVFDTKCTTKNTYLSFSVTTLSAKKSNPLLQTYNTKWKIEKI